MFVVNIIARKRREAYTLVNHSILLTIEKLSAIISLIQNKEVAMKSTHDFAHGRYTHVFCLMCC